jgi:hypothetical protein
MNSTWINTVIFEIPIYNALFGQKFAVFPFSLPSDLSEKTKQNKNALVVTGFSIQLVLLSAASAARFV